MIMEGWMNEWLTEVAMIDMVKKNIFTVSLSLFCLMNIQGHVEEDNTQSYSSS